MKQKHQRLISFLIPLVSVGIFLGTLLFLDFGVTGLAVYDPNGTSLVNADVTLKTKEGDIIPPAAVIRVTLDDHFAEMGVGEFIKRSNADYDINRGEVPAAGYVGPGYTGNHTYTLELSEFNIVREVGVGEHVFVTQILYRGIVLFEKENNIMIAKKSE